MSNAHRDRGLTLTEVLITITIVGIIMMVLSSATIVFLRNQGSASERIDETRGLQQLVNYLPGDVASAQMIKVHAGPDTCGTGGTPILHLSWQEEFGDTISRDSVTYRMFSGDGNRLTRFRCRDGSTTPTSQLDVAGMFSHLQVNSATFADGRVRISINYPETSNAPASRQTITAQSRNITEGA
jgi:prepilin-type N-terminal cleavage/methylation domain-containing protein